MSHFRVLFFVFFILLTTPMSWGSPQICQEIFEFKSRDSGRSQFEEMQALSASRVLAAQVASQTEKELKRVSPLSRKARGYSILVGTMVGSAALTTFMTSHLPSNFQFLSHLLAQVSTLGIYVFGAPIWEPLSSGFRKLAFGVQKHSRHGGSPFEEARVYERDLESLWLRTQEIYSLNAQMSRNIISQFIISVRQNFYEAHRAANSHDPEFAADQIAEAAFRMRVLFQEIRVDDPSVAAAVRSAFTHHAVINEHFIEKVMTHLQTLDREFERADVQAYYQAVLAAWLKI